MAGWNGDSMFNSSNMIVRAPDFRMLLPKGQHVLHDDRMDWEVDPDVLRPVALYC